MKDKNINLILEKIKKDKEITLLDIQNLLSIKERNAKNYIKYLKQIGINIECTKGIYSIKKFSKTDGKIIDKEQMRKLQIMTIVNSYNNKLSRKELIIKLKNDLCDKKSVSDKTLIRAVTKCEESNLIKKVNGRYNIVASYNTIYKISYDKVNSFLDKSNSFNRTIPFYFESRKIRDKIVLQCGYSGWDYSIFSLGRKYEIEDFSVFFRFIDKFNYKVHKIVIEFNSKKKILSLEVDVCTFLYSYDKDRIYIVCVLKDGQVILIRTNSIIQIKELDKPNVNYNNRKVLEQIDNIFQASVTKLYDVEVEFDNIYNMRSKILRIKENRKNSEVIELEDKIIYKDKLSGLYDFAAFLRSFGYACRVIKPLELKDIMKNTYEKILKNYEVIEK